MKKAVIVLLAGLLPSIASAAMIGPWPTTTNYNWETQPLAGYTSGPVVINGNQLWISSSNTGKRADFLPYEVPNGEKYSFAKFITGTTPLQTVHVKVFDPGTAAGWSVVLKNSTGKIIDFGVRPYVANGKVQGMIYDGVTASSAGWSGNLNVAARYKSGVEYWTMDFTPLTGVDAGKVKVDLTWLNATTVPYPTATYSWTTPIAFGGIEDVYLVAATSATAYTTFKFTEFTPEPATLLLLGLGLPMLRRRRVA